MTTIINASSSAGLVQTADTSAILQLQTGSTAAVTIDASQNVTISKPVALSGSTSGAITLAAPAVAGTNTATLPAATGTVMVSGNMPAFSAYQSTTQSVNSGTFTKIQLQTEEFDTSSAFDSTTNYRFTPQVAGYYQVSGNVGYSFTIGQNVITVYKNGSRFKDGNFGAGGTDGAQSTVSTLIYLNGSTDYIELWSYQNTGTAKSTTVGAGFTYFQAALVRTA